MHYGVIIKMIAFNVCTVIMFSRVSSVCAVFSEVLCMPCMVDDQAFRGAVQQ